MAKKLIENVNEDLWKKFVGLSKIDNKTVGDLLNEVIEEHITKRNIK